MDIGARGVWIRRARRCGGRAPTGLRLPHAGARRVESPRTDRAAALVVSASARNASLDRAVVSAGPRPLLGVPAPHARAQRRRAFLSRASTPTDAERAERGRSVDGSDADRTRHRAVGACIARRRRRRRLYHHRRHGDARVEPPRRCEAATVPGMRRTGSLRAPSFGTVRAPVGAKAIHGGWRTPYGVAGGDSCSATESRRPRDGRRQGTHAHYAG